MRIELRDPRLDAAIARFETWWSGLSQRERVLLTVLGVLLAGFVTVYGVVKPLQAARAEARAEIRTYETLSARIRAAGTLAPQGPKRTGTPAEIVQGAAQGQQLAVTADAIDGGVRATVANGRYDQVLNWIGEVSRSSPLAVASARITRKGEPGMVEAVVEFAP